MKLREKIKRFWTLDVHNHEGFTLVELIIVIAILAILSSVAVVGYSSYVTKANMQADKTLVAEIANALTLYYYANPNKVTDGYVVVTTDGSFGEENNAEIQVAMEAAFGEGWEEALFLKYNGWFTNTDGAEGSVAVTGDVGKITDSVTSLANLANVMSASNNDSVVLSVLSIACELNAEQKAELEKYQGDEHFSTVATNLMVKYISDELSNAKVDVLEVNGMQLPQYKNAEGGELSPVGKMAMNYALLYSMANSSDPAASNAAKQMLAQFETTLNTIAENEKNDPVGNTGIMNQVVAAWDTLTETGEYTDANGDKQPFADVYGSYVLDNAVTESRGIIAALDMFSSASDQYSDEASLKMEGLFSSDAIKNAVADFQLAVTAKGIVVRMQNGQCTVVPPSIFEP